MHCAIIFPVFGCAPSHVSGCARVCELVFENVFDVSKVCVLLESAQNFYLLTFSTLSMLNSISLKSL